MWMDISSNMLSDFKETVWDYYHTHGRDMPWRTDTNPYYILVSELMLQQTQVDRVIPKFEAFIKAFPTIEVLSEAALSDVLILWSGLGYNRRAKFLFEAAKMIVNEFDGSVPRTRDELTKLPGVGPNTAGAIMNYSFNIPTSFIETNIRTVYFHHFFDDEDKVSDSQIQNIVEQTLDTEHSREWHWALMDYGTYLKKQGVGKNTKSLHYVKQAPLKGSIREVRGIILRRLTRGEMQEDELKTEIVYDERFDVALEGLVADGLVERQNNLLYLTK